MRKVPPIRIKGNKESTVTTYYKIQVTYLTTLATSCGFLIEPLPSRAGSSVSSTEAGCMWLPGVEEFTGTADAAI